MPKLQSVDLGVERWIDGCHWVEVVKLLQRHGVRRVVVVREDFSPHYMRREDLQWVDVLHDPW